MNSKMNSKMKKVFFYIIIFVCISCNTQKEKANITDKLFPVITNEILKENIIEYVKINHCKSSTKNLVYMEFSTSHDTKVYTICSALSMSKFVNPNVSSIIKMDSIYIGYRNLNNSDIEMSTKAIVNILMDFSLFKDNPDMYYKRKKQNKYFGNQNEDYEIFIAVTGAVDIWTLKFVGDSLVSRSVYSEYDGSTRHF